MRRIVLGEIGKTDFRFSPFQSDGSDDHVHPLWLMGKDMLDLGSDF